MKKKIKCLILVNMYRKQSDCTEQWRVCCVCTVVLALSPVKLHSAYSGLCTELSSSWDKFCSALHCSAVYLSYGNKGFVKTVLTSVLVSIAV